jgi:hypothetical protein
MTMLKGKASMLAQLITAVVERWGYECFTCRKFHRAGHALYAAHLPHAREGLMWWTEKRAWVVTGGVVTPLPAGEVLGPDGRVRPELYYTEGE